MRLNQLPKYFRLWERIREDLQPGEFLPGRARKPKPEAIWREAEDALRQMAGQWSQRFELALTAKPGQEVVPPVLIVVCDNTDIAEVFFRNISGEREEEHDGDQSGHSAGRVQRALNPRLDLQGVLLTMYDQRNNLSDQVAVDVRGHFGARVFDTMIPRNVRIAEAPSHGKPVLIYDHGCAGAQAYIRLAAEVLRRSGAALPSMAPR